MASLISKSVMERVRLPGHGLNGIRLTMEGNRAMRLMSCLTSSSVSFTPFETI